MVPLRPFVLARLNQEDATGRDPAVIAAHRRILDAWRASRFARSTGPGSSWQSRRLLASGRITRTSTHRGAYEASTPQPVGDGALCFAFTSRTNHPGQNEDGTAVVRLPSLEHRTPKPSEAT